MSAISEERRSAPALMPWQTAVATAVLATRERWPHALLLTGRKGIGKRNLALHFAQALLCEMPRDDGGPCGRCAACGYVAAAAHPDLRVIEPIERDEDGNARRVDAILVDRIRELVDFAQLSTHRQRAKVALIAPAEAMNPAAANALLKTLEEPPPATYMMLVSDQWGRLPATIVSRCRVVAAPQPDSAAATAWLAQRGVAQPALLLAQAGGAPLAALAQPERLSPVAFGARLDAYPRDERAARLGDAVYWLLSWTADIARVSSGGAPRFNPDRSDALVRLAARVARLSLFRYYRSLLRRRELLGHPLQPRLVAEALLFEYRAAFARER